MISGQVNLISLFGYEILTVKNKTTYVGTGFTLGNVLSNSLLSRIDFNNWSQQSLCLLELHGTVPSKLDS